MIAGCDDELTGTPFCSLTAIDRSRYTSSAGTSGTNTWRGTRANAAPTRSVRTAPRSRSCRTSCRRSSSYGGVLTSRARNVSAGDAEHAIASGIALQKPGVAQRVEHFHRRGALVLVRHPGPAQRHFVRIEQRVRAQEVAHEALAEADAFHPPPQRLARGVE